MKRSQSEMILRYMQHFGSITPMDAMQDLGCMRLAARIADLRDKGYSIGSRTKKCTNRYGNTVIFAEYYLKEDKDE